jgi:hypothetical protein
VIVATMSGSWCQFHVCCGCFPVQCLAGSFVQFPIDEGSVGGAVRARVGSLAQVLADEAVGVSFVPRIHGEQGLAKNTPSMN